MVVEKTSALWFLDPRTRHRIRLNLGILILCVCGNQALLFIAKRASEHAILGIIGMHACASFAYVTVAVPYYLTSIRTVE